MSQSPSRSALRSPRIRFGVTLALGGALLAACGGSPTSAPGQGAANLPPQTNPGVADKDKGKAGGTTNGRTLAIKGQVVDVLTGEPVEKAMLFIEGVTTTIPFLRRVMDDPKFAAGEVDTKFLERESHLLKEPA